MAHRRPDTRPPLEPIELIVVDAGAPSPPTAGPVRIAPGAIVLAREPLVARMAARLLTTEWRPAPAGTDLTVRRLVDAPLEAAGRALTRLHEELLDEGGTGPDAPWMPGAGPLARLRAGNAWLLFGRPTTRVGTTATSATSEVRAGGRLHVHRFGPSLPIELVLGPWSGARAQLRLEAHPRHRLRLPQHFYDLAHPLVGSLRDRIEVRVPATHR